MYLWVHEVGGLFVQAGKILPYIVVFGTPPSPKEMNILPYIMYVCMSLQVNARTLTEYRNVQKYIDFLWVMDCSCDIWLFVGLAEWC